MTMPPTKAMKIMPTTNSTKSQRCLGRSNGPWRVAAGSDTGVDGKAVASTARRPVGRSFRFEVSRMEVPTEHGFRLGLLLKVWTLGQQPPEGGRCRVEYPRSRWQADSMHDDSGRIAWPFGSALTDPA